MVGLFLIVFVRTDIKQDISNIEHDSVKLGFLKQYGNKGAVIVRFRLRDTKFCFVCVHLEKCEI